MYRARGADRPRRARTADRGRLRRCAARRRARLVDCVVARQRSVIVNCRAGDQRVIRNPQLNANGELTHLLTLEGLPAEIIRHILDTALPFTSIGEREVKNVPLLRGKAVLNLFFESCTRTRTTFQIAAKRLRADVITPNVSA